MRYLKSKGAVSITLEKVTLCYCVNTKSSCAWFLPLSCFMLLNNTILSNPCCYMHLLWGKMPRFSYSLILEDKSFEKLGPCWSPRYIKYAFQPNAMYCFKLILPPFSWGKKVQHLKLKHTSVVPLRLLAWCQQPQHRAFIWASKCAGGSVGEGSGEEREGKLNAKRETNKQKRKMGWGG